MSRSMPYVIACCPAVSTYRRATDGRLSSSCRTPQPGVNMCTGQPAAYSARAATLHGQVAYTA
eukprot:2403635-Alexandrium_andersonii.AAC.1